MAELALMLLALALLPGAPSCAGRLRAQTHRRGRGLWMLSLAAAGGLIAFAALGRLSVAVAVILVCTCGLWFARDLLAQRHRRRAASALASYLGFLTADLRAGNTLAGALARAADSVEGADEALRRRLVAAAAAVQRGASAASALSGSGMPELERIGHSIELSAAHGVALSALLEQAQSRLDAQRRHAQATQASLQGPQATAIILACLPLAGTTMGAAMGAQPLRFLCGGGAGGIVLLVGTALVCAGFVWSRLIIRGASAC